MLRIFLNQWIPIQSRMKAIPLPRYSTKQPFLTSPPPASPSLLLFPSRFTPSKPTFNSESLFLRSQSLRSYSPSSFLTSSTPPPSPPSPPQQHQKQHNQKQHNQKQQNQKQHHHGDTDRNKRTGVLLGALVVFVLGGAYAAVPLYRLFCQATGYAGTTQRGDTVGDLLERAAAIPDASKRPFTVSFVSEVSAHLPWKFVPLQRSVTVQPGESALAFFQATSFSDQPIIGVATYNVAPSKAGAYFHKIQCFCFDEQRLEPHETVDMPVLFYLDPEILTDAKLANLDHITLSYTFFNSGADDLELIEEIQKENPHPHQKEVKQEVKE